MLVTRTIKQTFGLLKPISLTRNLTADFFPISHQARNFNVRCFSNSVTSVTSPTPNQNQQASEVKETKETKRDREYYWITAEAEGLIAKAYSRHTAIAHEGLPECSESSPFKDFPPSIGMKDLEAVGKPAHFKPEGLMDKTAFEIVKVLEWFMHLFFRTKYDHHAVTLETVAAVPGIVAAASRHLRSLRTMKRDHGWINPLQEEAENERMHLLIWMQHTKPSKVERFFVMFAQMSYVTFYTGLYAVSPKLAHRTTGYLEEAAHRAYTDYLAAIDSGAIKNVPAGKIAKKYYRLPDDATLRDVVLHVRGDECMHRDYNHHLANLHKSGRQDERPKTMQQ